MSEASSIFLFLAGAPPVSGDAGALGTLAALGTLVAGLVLWLVGGKLLKPATVVVGAGVGAMTLHTVLPGVLREPVGGFEPSTLGLAGGALLGTLTGLAAYRLALTVATAGVFALTASLGAGLWLADRPGALPSLDSAWTTAESPAASRAELYERAARLATEPNMSVTERADLATAARGAWASVPPGSRDLLLGAFVLGGVAGLIASVASARRSAAMVTAIVGSGAAIGAAAWLLTTLRLPGHEALNLSPMAWLGVWVVGAAIGASVQEQHRAKPAAA